MRWCSVPSVCTCRSVVVCEGMGLWAAAHADGSVLLRMLPAGHIAERHTIELARDAPPVEFKDSEFRAPFQVPLLPQSVSETVFWTQGHQSQGTVLPALTRIRSAVSALPCWTSKEQRNVLVFALCHL